MVGIILIIIITKEEMITKCDKICLPTVSVCEGADNWWILDTLALYFCTHYMRGLYTYMH